MNFLKHIDRKNTIMKKISFTTFLFPIIIFYLFENFTHNAFTTMKPHLQLLNILLFEFILLFLFMVFGRLRLALHIMTVLFFVWGIANYFIISFRSAPIMPWDIYSLKTAASVADNYKYSLSLNIVFTIIFFILLLIVEGFMKLQTSQIKFFKKHNLLRPMLLGICVLFFTGFTHMLHQDTNIVKLRLYDKLFTPTVMCKRDGTAVAFLMELRYMSVQKPNGYNKAEASTILDSYPSPITPAHTPNIIIVMDEAFSDLAVLDDFTTNEDYMPFTHSLMNGAKNTRSGYMNVSVLGGNTANTEFEFLTGNTMAFLPQGSIPYQQYVHDTFPSLASYLSDFGYRTIAMHPYHSTGWNRDKIYPYFGFDETYFMEDFKNPKLIRKYISDESAFDKIKQLFEEKKKEEPLFVFEVTMQNHSSYEEAFENFKPEITVNDAEGTQLNNYLSLMKLSDDALADLVSYLDSQQEDTLLVYFGDHQPTDSVVSPIWKLNNKNSNTLKEEDINNRYKVPFVLWANYDLESESNLETSANYLGVDVLKSAGINPSGYFAFLNELQQTYPVVTSICAKEADGTTSTVKESFGTSLDTYRTLQYNQLFQ